MPVPLAMPVTVVQPGFCQEGAKARERSERGEGAVPPSDGREIFENLGMKTAFSCTLNAITRG